jgi:hypothetical protein
MTKQLTRTIAMLALIAAISSPAANAAEQKKDAKAPPAAMKSDKDGNITLAAARELADKQFAMYDGNNDGNFDMKDYMVPFTALGKAKKIDMKKDSVDQKAIKESFARMDADKNGMVSRAEFKKDAELRHKMMDGNGDGVVSMNEIEALQKKLVAAHNKAKK